MAELFFDWRSQPKQVQFLRACGLSFPIEGGTPQAPKAKVIGFGGAAGGGKSDALLMAGIIAMFAFKGAKIGYFRRNFTQLQGPGGAIMRSMELLEGKAHWNGGLRRWTVKGGGMLQFCHLDRDEDVFSYQSQQFDIILFDEGTQFSSFQVRYMMTRLRSTTPNIKGTFCAIATNPGNIGHMWFKEQFVELGDPGQVHEYVFEDGGSESHMFIPSFLSDNFALNERDPDYRKNLESQPEHIRRQLLEGDWSAVEGVAFPEWRNGIHVVDDFEIPSDWVKFRSLDWGYAKPFSVGWFCVDYDGRLYKYREYYGTSGKKDEGARMDPEDVANEIIRMEQGEKMSYAVADDAIFGGRQDNSPSIAEQFSRAFGNKALHWQPVGKGPKSRIQGKLEMHYRLKWEKDDAGAWDGELPMLVFFKSCQNTIRLMPNLMLDPKNPEDVETHSQPDHIFDSDRYACMSRPMTPHMPTIEKSRIAKHKDNLAKRKKDFNKRLV